MAFAMWQRLLQLLFPPFFLIMAICLQELLGCSGVFPSQNKQSICAVRDDLVHSAGHTSLCLWQPYVVSSTTRTRGYQVQRVGENSETDQRRRSFQTLRKDAVNPKSPHTF